MSTDTTTVHRARVLWDREDGDIRAHTVDLAGQRVAASSAPEFGGNPEKAVARRRVLILNADPGLAEGFWLTRDYLPGFIGLIPERYRHPGYWEQELRGLLGEIEVRPVPVPHDCHDGFYQAYWRRPRAYLDSEVRDGISVFHHLPEAEVADAIKRLRRDLDEGRWEKRHRQLCEESELDVGLRLVVSELDRGG